MRVTEGVICQATQIPDKFVLPVDDRCRANGANGESRLTAILRAGMAKVLLDLQEEDRP